MEQNLEAALVESSLGANRPLFSNIAGFQSLINAFTNDPKDQVSPEHFMQTIEQIAVLANWSPLEKLTIARLKIKGEAMSFLNQNYEARITNDYEKFKQLFLNYFSPEVPFALKLQKLNTCRQQANQTIKEFANELNKLAHDYMEGLASESSETKKIVEAITLAQFMNGVNSDIRKSLIIKQPQNFEEAVKLANMIETHEQLSQDNIRVNALEKDGCEDMLINAVLAQTRSQEQLMKNVMEEINKLKMQVNNLSEPKEKNQVREVEKGNNFQKPMTQRACYICGRTNHIQRNCFLNPRNQRFNSSQFRPNSQSNANGNFSQQRDYRGSNGSRINRWSGSGNEPRGYMER